MPDSTQWQIERADLGVPAAKSLWIYLASGAAVALSVLGVLALPPADQPANPSSQALRGRSAVEMALGSMASADLALAPQVSLNHGSGVASLDGVLGDPASAPPPAAPPDAVAPPPRQTPARDVAALPRANQPAPRANQPAPRPQPAPAPAPRPQTVTPPAPRPQPAPQPVQTAPQPMWPAPQPMWPPQQGPAPSPPPGGYPYPAFGQPGYPW